MTKKVFKRKLNPNEEQIKLYDKITYLQTRIIKKISNLKKTKNNFTLCDHMQSKKNDMTYDPLVSYYDRFWRDYLLSILNLKKLQELQQNVKELEQSVNQIQVDVQLCQKKFQERQSLLNMPAFNHLRKTTSKLSRSNKEEKRQDGAENNFGQNGIVQTKKEEEVEAQLINYQQEENNIFEE